MVEVEERKTGPSVVVHRTQNRTFVNRDGLHLEAVVWGASPEAAADAEDWCAPRRWIALHGWLDNAGTWDALMPGLIVQLGCVVSLDMAGHGRSEHRNAAYHHVDYVADLHDVADALGWRTFGIIGHSMGGSVAAIYAGTQPERVRQLITVEAVGPWCEPPSAWPDDLGRALQKRASGNPPRFFADAEAAAQRRSAGNVVGSLHLQAARTLCARGLVTRREWRQLRRSAGGVDSPSAGSGDSWTDLAGGEAGAGSDARESDVTWRTDPQLMLGTRLSIGPEATHAVLRRVACPVLLVTGHGGLLRNIRSTFLTLWGRVSPWHRLIGAVLLGVSRGCGALAAVLGALGATQRARPLAKLAYGAWHLAELSARRRSLDTFGRLRHVDIPGAGHHLHLEPGRHLELVATAFREALSDRWAPPALVVGKEKAA
jgi:pimeloyl-ACP methyl ester carboxylesterase